MDSEDICLSVFLCIYVDEGMEVRNKLSVSSRTCESGYVRQNQVDYTHHLCTSGRRKEFCRNKPRRYRDIGAQKEILSE